MRILIPIILFIVSTAQAEDYPSCDISETKIVSFTSISAKDKLTISVKGSPCYDGQLSIELQNEQGVGIYKYQSRFKQHNSVHWAEKDFDVVALNQVKHMIEHAITTSSELPERLPCEVPVLNCEPYEKNSVPMETFKAIRASNLPMLNHSTYYEGWASFIYDNEHGKTIKVLEGGL